MYPMFMLLTCILFYSKCQSKWPTAAQNKQQYVVLYPKTMLWANKRDTQMLNHKFIMTTQYIIIKNQSAASVTMYDAQHHVVTNCVYFLDEKNFYKWTSTHPHQRHCQHPTHNKTPTKLCAFTMWSECLVDDVPHILACTFRLRLCAQALCVIITDEVSVCYSYGRR